MGEQGIAEGVPQRTCGVQVALGSQFADHTDHSTVLLFDIRCRQRLSAHQQSHEHRKRVIAAALQPPEGPETLHTCAFVMGESFKHPMLAIWFGTCISLGDVCAMIVCVFYLCAFIP